MPSFFPRQTIDWRAVEEPAAFRKLSLSLLEMGLITGIVLRVLRAVTFTTGRASWLVFAASLLVALVILVAMATAHLANFSLQRWTWRAPTFAAVVTVGAMVTSLALIAMHREPEGTVRADYGDWPSMSLRFLLYSELVVCLWALVLAGVILLVRRSGIRTGAETADG